MDEKQWWKSKTMISLLIAGAGMFAPKYAPLINDLAGPTLDLIGN